MKRVRERRLCRLELIAGGSEPFEGSEHGLNAETLVRVQVREHVVAVV